MEFSHPSLPFPAPEGQFPAEKWNDPPRAGRLSALFGPKSILRLGAWLAAPALLEGESVLVADGGNSFNPYDFSGIAARAGRKPRELLGRIHVSRAFTCHQMRALVGEVPRLARARGIRLVLLPGLTATFYDEAVSAREARAAWRRTLALLRDLADSGFLLLALCPDHSMERKRPLRPSLVGAAHRVAACREEEGRLRLRPVKPPGRACDLTPPGALAAVWGFPGR